MPFSFIARPRVSARVQADTTTAPADVKAPFVTYDAAPTISELLAADDELAQYVKAFADAALEDVALAAEMSLADLQAFLPSAPLAHCLKLRRLFATNRTTLKPLVSEHPCWLLASRTIAANACDGSLRERSLARHEFDLIGGSLFLAFSIAPLLAPATSCAGDQPCPALLTADLLLWTCLTASLLTVVVLTWASVIIESAVTNASFAQWMLDHWRFYTATALMFVASLTILPVAISVRLFILVDGHPNYPPWLAGAIMAVLVIAMCLQWTCYAACTFSTFGLISTFDFVLMDLGALGLHLPWTRAKAALTAKPVSATRAPYMEMDG